MEVVPEILGFLLEFVQVHVVDVERLAAVGQNLLFHVARCRLALTLTVVTTKRLKINKLTPRFPLRQIDAIWYIRCDCARLRDP